MTAEERETVEKLLLRERELLIEALDQFEKTREMSLQDETGELTAYRLHPADLGTEAMEREKQFLLASNDGRQLYEVLEALRRLYQQPEEFGICERCGAEITMERLSVVPATTLCARCQRELESTGEGMPGQ